MARGLKVECFVDIDGRITYLIAFTCISHYVVVIPDKPVGITGMVRVLGLGDNAPITADTSECTGHCIWRPLIVIV